MKNQLLKNNILITIKIWILSSAIGATGFLLIYHFKYTLNNLWLLPWLFIVGLVFSLLFTPLFVFCYGWIQRLNVNDKVKIIIMSIVGIICTYLSFFAYALNLYGMRTGNLAPLFNIFTNPYFAAIIISILLVNWQQKLFVSSKSEKTTNS